MQRRRFLHCALAGGSLAGLAATGTWPFAARAVGVAGSGHAGDWAWLAGGWDVRHRRLRERLANSQDWESFGGRSALWQTLGGLGNLDDNIVELPAGTYRGLSLRAYDAASDTWAIWWLDGRDPTRIDPPVHGGFHGDTGVFTGHDTLRGKPIVMRFTWRDVHGARPWWEQAFSGDEGHRWEVNWQNWFTRTADTPAPLPLLPDAPRDWDFLRGQWRIRHRRLPDPFAGGGWETFDGTLAHWPVLGGHGHAMDLSMRPAGGNEHAVRLHTYDPGAKAWLAWHLDLANPTRIGPPDRGRFAEGKMAFLGEARLRGRAVKTRTTWMPTGPDTIRRELAVSVDGGSRWFPWWTSELIRAA